MFVPLLSSLAIAQHELHPDPASEGPRAAIAVQQTFAQICKRTLPSVVCVRAFERVPADVTEPAPNGPKWVNTEPAEYEGMRVFSAGSGFVVDGNGDILTCTHLLQKADGSLADLIDIELVDATRVICEVIGTEPTVNLAILQPMVFPNGHSQKLPPLRFGDSDATQPGDWALGFGDPFGPAKYFAVGSFVAQPSRDCYQDYLSAFFAQVSMVAHPEAYGGPIVDVHGDVIGILAPRHPKPGGLTDEPRYGIEYVMPGKIVQGLYEAIRQSRSTRSPWLGYSVMSRPEIARVRGLEAYQAMEKPKAGILIENVFEPSQAMTVDIRPGDWLTAFGETRIFTPVDFQKALYIAGIGAVVELELWRDGETTRKKIVVEERPKVAAPR